MFPDSVDQEFRQELGGHICSKQFGALAIKMWMAGPGGGEKCVTMWLEDGNHLRCLSPDVCWLRLVAGWNFSMDLSWIVRFKNRASLFFLEGYSVMKMKIKE